MFCMIVGQVGFSWGPVNTELALVALILQPIKLHVDGLGPFLFKGFVGKTNSGRVVDFNRGWWLWVPHFYQTDAKFNSFLGCHMCCAYFGLCRGPADYLDDGTDDMDGPVEVVFFHGFPRGWFVGEKEMPTGAAPCFWDA